MEENPRFGGGVVGSRELIGRGTPYTWTLVSGPRIKKKLILKIQFSVNYRNCNIITDSFDFDN